MKYLILTGGVCSSLGKGFAASALGALLQALGFCVTIIKIDPYINEDAGLLRPREHGEVFVLQDGGETDLDLGHYERALGKNLGSQNIWTTGKIYRRLLDKERSGFFLGKTVQLVPHFTDEVGACIQQLTLQEKNVLTLVEVGGTVGDLESLPFLEALRRLRQTLPRPRDMIFFHLSFVPKMGGGVED